MTSTAVVEEFVIDATQKLLREVQGGMSASSSRIRAMMWVAMDVVHRRCRAVAVRELGATFCLSRGWMILILTPPHSTPRFEPAKSTPCHFLFNAALSSVEATDNERSSSGFTPLHEGGIRRVIFTITLPE
jgi:hypothetical protein